MAQNGSQICRWPAGAQIDAYRSASYRSTSVLRLAAKPIIDLMPVITNLDELDRKRSLVETLGYSWYGELGLAGRRYCALADADGSRIAQLHFFTAESPQIARHLAFRDYLRAHPKEARAYEYEKRRARDLFPNDSHAYTDEKAAWIERTQAEALKLVCQPWVTSSSKVQQWSNAQS